MADVQNGANEILDLEGQRALAEVLQRLGSPPLRLHVGRYRVGESLGRGGCGEVFAGHDPELDREVAIKVVLRGRERPTEAAEARLLREAQALARLRHPNIVQIYDVGIDEIGAGAGARARRGAYIIMERIRGLTLAEWIARHPPGAEAIVAAYGDAARGLAAAHGLGVVHRDFKPANAMTTPDGRVVVLDFGLASAFEGLVSTAEHAWSDAGGSSSGSASGRSSQSLTQTGIVMGTPRYMAPEQHDAQPATPASDQYAWCVSLWEALAGVPPFAGADMTTLARAKRAGAPRRPPAIPPHLYRVLARGLAIDPADRFASMTRLSSALEQRPRQRARLAIGLAGLGLAIGGATLVVETQQSLAVCRQPAHMSEGQQAPDAIAGLRASLLQRHRPVSAVELEQIEARVTRFDTDWESARGRVCASIHDLPASIAESRNDCLERARERFDAAIVQVRDRGPDDLPWISGLWGLRSPLRCDGPDAEVAFVVAAEDGPEVDAVRAHIEGALAASRPRFPGWEGVVEHALGVAEDIDDHWLAVGALALRGRILAQEHRFEESADAGSLAAWRAHGAGDGLLAAEILPHAISMLAAPSAPTAEIDRLIGVARDIAREIGDPPRLLAEIDAVECWSLEMRGDLDAALAGYEAHIDRLNAHAMSSTPEYLTRALWRMGQLQRRMDQPWAAKATLGRALSSMSDEARSIDPMRYADIEAQLSRAAFDCGDFETAAASAVSALAGFRGEGGSAGYATRALAWYGYVLGARGQLDEGRALVEEAIARSRARGRQPMLPELLGQLGFLHELAGAPDASAQLVEEVRLLLSDHRGASPRSPIYHFSAIARLQGEAGYVAEATVSLAKAEAAYDKLAGVEGADPFAESGRFSPIPRARAWVAAARGDWETARASVSTALRDPELHVGTPVARGKLGKLYVLLARVLAEQGDGDGAREVASLAAATLAGALPSQHRDRAAAARLRGEPVAAAAYSSATLHPR